MRGGKWRSDRATENTGASRQREKVGTKTKAKRLTHPRAQRSEPACRPGRHRGRGDSVLEVDAARGWSTIPATMANRSGKKVAARRKAAPRTRVSTKDRKHRKEAVTLTVVLRARTGQEPLLEAELRALVGPTRREEGCVTYELHRSADTPGGYLLHEVWASREHHHAHTQTPHFIRWNARKDALLVSRDATFWKQLA
jgi:quinol monooxygenase YgiN